MLSFSTCWNSGRHSEGVEMIQEILGLGFENIELGHGVRLPLAEGILKMCEQGKVKISSLHNFCPLPPEIPRASPDCYQFTAQFDGERDRAVRHTFKTIDFAQRVGAKFVVMHLGSVPIGDYTRELVRLAETGEHLSKQFVQMKIEAIKKREAKQEKLFARMIECLRPIVDYAGQRGIRLGIESRHSFEEMPSEREMIEVLNRFDPSIVGYWHDFGHVQVKHNLGFLDHFEWLQRVAPRLIGCHLHDTKWPGRDHLAPFMGDVEYHRLIPLLPKDTLFVFEMSPRRTKEEITTALATWKERFGA
ncbi:MAG: TIM barrel protein [Chthoniobacteraceae bacterium]